MVALPSPNTSATVQTEKLLRFIYRYLGKGQQHQNDCVCVCDAMDVSFINKYARV